VPDVHALWEAATPDARLALAALFSGLTLPELAGLSWAHVDFDRNSVSIGVTRRVQPITIPFSAELKAKRHERIEHDAVAVPRSGHPYSVEDLEGLIAAAAHDAGLEQSATVDAAAVRQTYINFLVRQGVRLSELERVVGPIPASAFLYYRNLSPAGAGRPFAALDFVFPAFRNS
jgi:integrase